MRPSNSVDNCTSEPSLLTPKTSSQILTWACCSTSSAKTWTKPFTTSRSPSMKNPTPQPCSTWLLFMKRKATVWKLRKLIRKFLRSTLTTTSPRSTWQSSWKRKANPPKLSTSIKRQPSSSQANRASSKIWASI